MSDLDIIVPSVVLLCGALLWLFRRSRRSRENARLSANVVGENARLAARHYQYFPSIRQALSMEDRRYLLEAAPRQVAEKTLRERRAVARQFLKGLHEDFSNLARLGRMIATLSPAVSHQQEMERVILSVKFQLLYTVVWCRLFAGTLPLTQLEDLAGFVGKLATRMELAIAEVNALSASHLPGNLST